MAFKINRLVATPLLTTLLAATALHGICHAAPTQQHLSSTKAALLDRIIVIVNDDVILQSDLQERIDLVIKQIEQQPNAAHPPKKILIEQILDRMILERLQLQMANQMGVRISDNELNEALKAIAQQNKMNLQQFQNQLTDSGLNYAQLRQQIRRDMLLREVQQRRIGSRIQVTDQDANTFLSSPLGKERLAADYRIHHILLATEEGALDNGPDSAAELANQLYQQLLVKPDTFNQLAMEHSDSQTALEGGDLGWRPVRELPTLFADTVINMSVGDVSQPIKSASGYHLIRLADRRGKTERMVHQYKVRHILIKPNEIRSNLAAKQLITEIYNKLAAGGTFAELAQTYSDDPGSARLGGDLGWVSPGQMVPAFEMVMTTNATGQLSQPFESQFGWHILEVTDSRTEDMSDAFRMSQAKNFVFKRKFEEELPIWLREIRQDAFVEQKVSVETLTSSL